MRWSEVTVSPQLLTALVEGCWEFGKLMLGKAGEFYPFAETADHGGKRTMLGGHTGEEHPDPRQIYALLQEGIAAGIAEGTVAAAALAVNVNIPAEYQPQFPDGIRVHVEAPGFSRFIYLPYRIEPRGVRDRLLRRPLRVNYAEPFSVETDSVFFARWGSTPEGRPS